MFGANGFDGDGTDWGVGASFSFNPGAGISGAVTTSAGNAPTQSCPTCGGGGNIGGLGFNVTPGMIILAVALVILATR